MIVTVAWSLSALMDVNEAHSNLTVTRFKQWWGDQADVFIPARPRNLGLTFITVKSRTGGVDFINVPNWPSTTDRSTIQVNDFDRP